MLEERLPRLPTYRLPAASKAMPCGKSRCVFGPTIESVGGTSPVAPAAQIRILLTNALTTYTAPAASRATSCGLVSPVVGAAIVAVGLAAPLAAVGQPA